MGEQALPLAGTKEDAREPASVLQRHTLPCVSSTTLPVEQHLP